MIEERDQLLRRAGLEAFGDVVRDGEHRAIELVLQVASVAKPGVCADGVHPRQRLRRGLPHRQLLEPTVLHARSVHDRAETGWIGRAWDQVSRLQESASASVKPHDSLPNDTRSIPQTLGDVLALQV